MLDGHDNGWLRLPAGVRTATWSSLPPGNYTMRVKASLDGYRPVEKELRITINPPFWLSTHAKIGYIVVILVGAALIYRFYAGGCGAARNGAGSCCMRRLPSRSYSFSPTYHMRYALLSP